MTPKDDLNRSVMAALDRSAFREIPATIMWWKGELRDLAALNEMCPTAHAHPVGPSKYLHFTERAGNASVGVGGWLLIVGSEILAHGHGNIHDALTKTVNKFKPNLNL